MILPITVYGNPILREPAPPVAEDSPALQKLIGDMIETMHNADGIGLAAPQVGRTERVFVIDVTPMAEEIEAEGEGVPAMPMAFVNPEILAESDDAVDFEEGCLSIPDLRESVTRPERIRLRYRDRNFEEHEAEFSGFLARVLQHEYDHLEGVLFVDYLTPLKRRLLKRRLRNMAAGRVEAEYPLAI